MCVGGGGVRARARVCVCPRARACKRVCLVLEINTILYLKYKMSFKKIVFLEKKKVLH